MESTEISQAIANNFLELWKCQGQADNVDAFDHGGYWTLAGTVDHPLANAIAFARLGETNVSEKIDGAISYFTDMGRPCCWFTGTTDQPSNLDDLLEAKGLIRGTEVSSAAMAAKDFRPAKVKEHIKIERVRDEASLRTYTDVFAASYEAPAEIADWFFEIFKQLGLSEDKPMQHYLGLVDGEPLGCHTTFLHDHVLGSYNTGTLPQARGKGVATAMMISSYLDGIHSGAELVTGQGVGITIRMFEGWGGTVYGKKCVFVHLPQG